MSATAYCARCIKQHKARLPVGIHTFGWGTCSCCGNDPCPVLPANLLGNLPAIQKASLANKLARIDEPPAK